MPPERPERLLFPNAERRAHGTISPSALFFFLFRSGGGGKPGNPSRRSILRPRSGERHRRRSRYADTRKIRGWIASARRCFPPKKSDGENPKIRARKGKKKKTKRQIRDRVFRSVNVAVGRGRTREPSSPSAMFRVIDLIPCCAPAKLARSLFYPKLICSESVIRMAIYFGK